MKLILVEDSVSLGKATRTSLIRNGMACDLVKSAAEFNTAMVNHSYDCVLLDLGLPDGHGSELLKNLRRKGDMTPVIVVTAQWQVESSVGLLNNGADEYVVKPYDIRELVARIRALMRRARTVDSGNSLVHGPLVLQIEARVASWYGNLVPLRKKEYWLLEAMLRNRHSMLTRAQLEEALYGWGEEAESNTIEVYIHYLRRKFSTKLIVNVRGLGYQICDATAFSTAPAIAATAAPA